MKKLKEFIVYWKTILILAWIITSILIIVFGCNSTKMINSPYGKVHKYQIKEIERVKSENNID